MQELAKFAKTICKLNRSVPKWADVILGFIAGVSYAASISDIKQAGGSPGAIASGARGALIASIVLCFFIHWLLGWCFGVIRTFKRRIVYGAQVSRVVGGWYKSLWS